MKSLRTCFRSRLNGGSHTSTGNGLSSSAALAAGTTKIDAAITATARDLRSVISLSPCLEDQGATAVKLIERAAASLALEALRISIAFGSSTGLAGAEAAAPGAGAGGAGAGGVAGWARAPLANTTPSTSAEKTEGNVRPFIASPAPTGQGTRPHSNILLTTGPATRLMNSVRICGSVLRKLITRCSSSDCGLPRASQSCSQVDCWYFWTTLSASMSRIWYWAPATPATVSVSTPANKGSGLIMTSSS